jgi:hypothetical protein
MKNSLLLAILLVIISVSIHSQEKRNEEKYYVDKPDTMEQGLINQFRKRLDNAETVIDAQVVSMESKWDNSKEGLFQDGSRLMITTITFKINQWIKGTMEGDEVKFYTYGGKIGDTVQEISHSAGYTLNERLIFFLGNKEQNTKIIDKGRVKIFGTKNGKPGNVILGYYSIASERYIDLLKKSVKDTTVIYNYIHRLKMAEEEIRLAKQKYKNGALPTDSI